MFELSLRDLALERVTGSISTQSAIDLSRFTVGNATKGHENSIQLSIPSVDGDTPLIDLISLTALGLQNVGLFSVQPDGSEFEIKQKVTLLPKCCSYVFHISIYLTVFT